MAPLHEAIQASLVRRTDSEGVYRGEVDSEWAYGHIPNGGYTLGLILESVMQYQAGMNHPDPVHVTAHFMRPPTPGAFEVHIEVLKTGRSFRNITAKLVQDNADIVLTHIICGFLQPEDDTRPGGHTLDNLTLAPPSPFTVQTPMHTHPSRCDPQPPVVTWTFKDRVLHSRDPVYDKRTRDTPAVGGIEIGEYFTLTGEEERLTLPMLGFFADCFLQMPLLLPALQETLFYLPTLMMTLELKFPIPKLSAGHYSQRSVAVYWRGKFVNDPLGRHDTYLEIWTAPSNIGEGTEEEGWKEKQRCLAVSTQTCVVMPAEVNYKRAGLVAGQSKL